MTVVAVAALSASATLLAASPAFAATLYYVSPSGSDSNAGSLASPFLTIQKCATVAVAGDSCLMRAGTYRETVTPAASGTASAPITFAPYNGENVVVSGANQVSGWTNYSGQIYVASVTLPVSNETSDDQSTNNAQAGTIAANQVFVNGSMVGEAQWPNATSDLSHPTTSTAQTGSGEATIVDSTLPTSTDFTGAIMHQVNTRGWTATTGYVTADSGSTLTIKRFGCVGNCAGVGSKYFLTGGNNGLASLDAAGEWWYDWTNHKLYLWAPSGGNPGSTVEYKSRINAFDLSGRSYVNLVGLTITGATVATSDTSSHVLLDRLTAKYVSHSLTASNDPVSPSCGIYCSHQTDTGIILRGSSNTLQNSEVSGSAGALVAVFGSGNVVTNNLLHDGDYLGVYPGLVNVAGTAGSTTITNNTLYNTGRFAIGIQTSPSAPVRIAYNNIYDYGIQTRDLGAVYTCCAAGGNSRADHNWIHDSEVADGYSTSVFLDDSETDFQVDHNVAWSVGRYGIKLNASGGDGTAYNDLWYNNTLAPGLSYSDGGYVTDGTGSTFTNNVWSHGSKQFESTPTNATVVTNLASTTRPKFVNTAVHDFRLQSTSPAINAGTVVSGVTDGYVGSAPDQGAYEYGGVDWIAGCDLTACATRTDPYLGIKGPSYGSQSGTTLEASSDGGRDVASINNGDWVAYPGLDLSAGAATLNLRVASPRSTPGTIEARVGSPTGTLVATCTVPNTGGWQVYTGISCPVSGLTGTQTIYLVARNTASTTTLFNIGWLRFATAPVTTLNPRVQQEAEQYDAQSGTDLEYASGGSIADVDYISNGDWTRYDSVAFGSTSPTSVKVSAANATTATSTVEFRLGSTTGTLVGTCSVAPTGGWQVYAQSTCSVSGATGTQTLFAVFKGGSGNLLNLDWFTFS